MRQVERIEQREAKVAELHRQLAERPELVEAAVIGLSVCQAGCEIAAP